MGLGLEWEFIGRYKFARSRTINKYKNRIFKASNLEIIKNPPSRSAKLRYAIRSKNKFIYPKELVNKFKRYLDLENLHA